MQPWMRYAHQLEAKYGIPQGLFVALVRQESGGRMVNSRAGAIGPAQLMPATAQSLGVDPYNFNQNLDGGARYFAAQLKAFGNDPRKALAAYNAGPGAVQRYGGVPPYSETRDHGNKVMGYWAEARGQRGMPTATPAGSAYRPAQSPSGPATVQVGVMAPVGPPPVDELELSNQINRIRNAYRGYEEYAKRPIDKITSEAEAKMARWQAQILGQQQQFVSIPTGYNQGRPAQGTQSQQGTTVGNGFFARKPGETGQQYLDRLLIGKFGLRHDAGNSQTTGGQHREGSRHYAGLATDFGNAKNDPRLLQRVEDFVDQNRHRFVGGISELLYGADVPGHDDHIHIATQRSSKGPKTQSPIGQQTAAIAPLNTPPITKRQMNAPRRARKRRR